MSLWKKKKLLNSTEFKELIEKLNALHRRIDMLDIDLSLQTDKLAKAISKKAITKKEETDTDTSKNPVLLPE